MPAVRKKACQHPLLVMTNAIYSRKGVFLERKRIISGLHRESFSPGIGHTAPRQLRSPPGQTCLGLFLSQPSGSDTLSNQKSILFLPLKLHFMLLFLQTFVWKASSKKKSWLRSALVSCYTSLELKTAWNKLKRTKPGLCLPVSRYPGLVDAPGAFRGIVQRRQAWEFSRFTAKGQE